MDAWFSAGRDELNCIAKQHFPWGDRNSLTIVLVTCWLCSGRLARSRIVASRAEGDSHGRGFKMAQRHESPARSTTENVVDCGSESYVWSARGVLDNNILEVVKSAETFPCLP